MIKELSILIPVYNDDATRLICHLYRQAQAITGLCFEIVVFDDGSTDGKVVEAHQALTRQLKNCRLVKSEHHTCRAAMRNSMFHCGKYAWHLMVDARLTLKYDDFLLRYLCCDIQENEVACGGIEVIGGDKERELYQQNLRFRYEKFEERKHVMAMREKNPYASFRTTNFFYSRSVLEQVPYDESIKGYGYEDVMLGKSLRQHHIKVVHIDNPVAYTEFESNEAYLYKVDEALTTLHDFSDALREYSPLLRLIGVLEQLHLLTFIKKLHFLLCKKERANLCGNCPSLLVLKLYKLGYYLTLE